MLEDSDSFRRQVYSQVPTCVGVWFASVFFVHFICCGRSQLIGFPLCSVLCSGVRVFCMCAGTGQGGEDLNHVFRRCLLSFYVHSDAAVILV